MPRSRSCWRRVPSEPTRHLTQHRERSDGLRLVLGAERNAPFTTYDTSGPYTDPAATIDRVRAGIGKFQAYVERHRAAGVNIDEIVVRPRDQATARMVHRATP